MKQLLSSMILFLLFFTTVPGWSADAEKCKDHPLFTRMSNYEIYWCTSSEFDAVNFPKPELKEWSNPGDYTNVEGKIYAVSYKLKDGVRASTSLQIIRNFQNAVKNSGGSVLGDYRSGTVYPSLPESATKFLSESPGGTFYERYTTMTLTKKGSEFWIYLCASDDYNDYTLLLVEKQKMKQEISINDLINQINKVGFLTYYINFDTGKWIIKPESESSIEQIVALLKGAPLLKVSIEGHTDNVGSPESNMKLSKARAKAVMDAVVAKGVSADRLKAEGRGQEAPIADNRKEEGRALNRRVEVVKR
jgi:OOP family OmpA-OmpF porin